VLRSVQITDSSQVSVLGQSDRVVEYQPDTDASTRYEQQADGLHVSCVRAQRIYNNHYWPNPLVLKITHARARR
jgi:alpha-L-fucosidase